jgi:hypothetical protein
MGERSSWARSSENCVSCCTPLSNRCSMTLNAWAASLNSSGSLSSGHAMGEIFRGDARCDLAEVLQR